MQSVTPTLFILLYLNLHNDCSHIEDVHLLFYAHFMDIFFHFWGILNLDIFFR